MKIRETVDDLIRAHDTRNPFDICRDLEINIIYPDLIEIRGFCMNENGIDIINISNDLDSVATSFVCAHELGHFILHPGMNRIFLDTQTYFVTQKYENEANRFAVDLLYDDSDLYDFLTYPIEKAANYMGVSFEIAAYRMKQVADNYNP